MRVCAEWPNRRLYRNRKPFFFLSFCTVLKRGKSGGFGNTNAKLESEEREEKQVSLTERILHKIYWS